MPRLGLGLGLSRIGNRPLGAGVTLGFTIATNHAARVAADSGTLPVSVETLASVLDSVISAYSISSESDFNTKVPVFADPYYTGYKLGAGSGITAGQAAQKLYAINSSADMSQATAASQPLLLAYSGVNYWFGSGVSGNYCSTPNAAANQITGDIEIIVKIDYKNNSSLQMIVSKSISTGNNFCYDLYIDSSNIPVLQYSINGSAALSGTCSTNIGATYSGWLKANRISSTGVIKFYTSTDGITWTQLGTNISGTSGSIYNATSTLGIGQYISNSSLNFLGKIYRATISNSIGGSPVVDFNPQSYSASTSQTQWTSATGEVWTINTGTATGGYKGQIVDRTYIQNDGVDDSLIAVTSGSGIKTQYFTHKVLSNTSGMPFGLWTGAAFSQAFYYPSGAQYGFYQSGAQDGPFGGNVISTKKLRVSGAVGGTGTNWIPFQDGVDVSNGGANIGSSTSYTSIRIGVRGNDTGYDNGIVGNYIISGQADTAPQRTAIQALLKTMSNL